MQVIETYDGHGYYRNPNGSLDCCHTEVEVLGLLHHFLRSIKPRCVLETGTYRGLSTCFLAAALCENGLGGTVHAIDPWAIPHLWEGSELEAFVTWHPLSSQDALPEIEAVAPLDFMFIDSIHTYAQSSWEVAHFEPLLRPGGYIALHDSLVHNGVGRTVQHLYDSPRFEVITLETPRTHPTDKFVGGQVSVGLTLARKIRDGSPIVQDYAWLDVPEHMPQGPDSHIRLHARLMSGE